LLFCSHQFCAFLAIVIAAYWCLHWHSARVYVLLAASAYFYASWNRSLALVLCGSAVLDYLLALGMDSCKSSRIRKSLLLLSLASNLGLLCYFKYANFFLRSAEETAASLGLQVALPTLRVILPVGISFYTFEAINYTVEVYRRTIRAERRLAHFLLFILFFPHLMAGPIVRARDFLPQIGRRKRWSWPRAHAGVMLIVFGVLKKLAIADRMALYSDPVFADPAAFGSLAAWGATIAYALQVYCDFSGYSDMAMGLAYLFGYHLAVNFDAPFLAANIGEFWRRWHMSLSTWIRDYVFIPLGGSRGTRVQTARNVVVTMTLCGLWHGANWNCVLWGLLNGILLVGHAAFAAWCRGRPRLRQALARPAGTVLRTGLTIAAFCLTLAVFRAQGVHDACLLLARMLRPVAGLRLTLPAEGLWLTVAVVAIAHLLCYRDRWRELWERIPVPIRGLGLASMLTLGLIIGPGASKAFVYFQF
jgi:alginate O-acetyltransferase complex protein AlgI